MHAHKCMFSLYNKIMMSLKSVIILNTYEYNQTYHGITKLDFSGLLLCFQCPFWTEQACIMGDCESARAQNKGITNIYWRVTHK